MSGQQSAVKPVGNPRSSRSDRNGPRKSDRYITDQNKSIGDKNKAIVEIDVRKHEESNRQSLKGILKQVKPNVEEQSLPDSAGLKSLGIANPTKPSDEDNGIKNGNIVPLVQPDDVGKKTEVIANPTEPTVEGNRNKNGNIVPIAPPDDVGEKTDVNAEGKVKKIQSLANNPKIDKDPKNRELKVLRDKCKRLTDQTSDQARQIEDLRAQLEVSNLSKVDIGLGEEREDDTEDIKVLKDLVEEIDDESVKKRFIVFISKSVKTEKSFQYVTEELDSCRKKLAALDLKVTSDEGVQTETVKGEEVKAVVNGDYLLKNALDKANSVLNKLSKKVNKKECIEFVDTISSKGTEGVMSCTSILQKLNQEFVNAYDLKMETFIENAGSTTCTKMSNTGKLSNVMNESHNTIFIPVDITKPPPLMSRGGHLDRVDSSNLGSRKFPNGSSMRERNYGSAGNGSYSAQSRGSSNNGLSTSRRSDTSYADQSRGSFYNKASGSGRGGFTSLMNSKSSHDVRGRGSFRGRRRPFSSYVYPRKNSYLRDQQEKDRGERSSSKIKYTNVVRQDILQ